jgi:hypothetical protein
MIKEQSGLDARKSNAPGLWQTSDRVEMNRNCCNSLMMNNIDHFTNNCKGKQKSPALRWGFDCHAFLILIMVDCGVLYALHLIIGIDDICIINQFSSSRIGISRVILSGPTYT